MRESVLVVKRSDDMKNEEEEVKVPGRRKKFSVEVLRNSRGEGASEASLHQITGDDLSSRPFRSQP